MPLVNEEHITFCVGARFKDWQPDVTKALRRIKQSPNSKFRVVKEGTAAPGAVCFNDLQGVVAWACSVRRTLNELGPKTYGVDGVAMPT